MYYLLYYSSSIVNASRYYGSNRVSSFVILIVRDRVHGGFGRLGGVDGLSWRGRVWNAPIYKDMRIELLLVRSRMWNASSESQYGDGLI